jgi:hypothetical protein
MFDKTYILTYRSPGSTPEADEELRQALAQTTVRARVTHRLPWGAVVRSDPSLVTLVRRQFPHLDIAEEGFADLAGS